jgi:hypothetical protein
MQYKASIDKGGEKYWHPTMITYWENIYKDLVMPFMINENSRNTFYPFTMWDINNNIDIQPKHEVMKPT